MPKLTAPRDSDNRVPVSIITGFLGSGKTTLLNRLVRHPGMADTALIVNEFGEVGIDHELVDSAFENTVLMESGCICCSIRGDLIDTINDLFANAEQGNIPSFSRILVETTGLADPVPVVHALQASETLIGRCRLGTVITTLDAQQGARQLQAHREVARQIAVADMIVVTKTDIAGAEPLRGLMPAIQALNPGVAVRTAIDGVIDPEELFRHRGGAGRPDPIAPFDAEESGGHGLHEHEHDGHDHVHTHGTEHGAIGSTTVTADEPLPYERLVRFLETLVSLRGDKMLRIKGILHIEGVDQPVVVQGVGASFSRPYILPEWPSAKRRSRLVLIYEGLPPDAIATSFAAIVTVPKASS